MGGNAFPNATVAVDRLNIIPTLYAFEAELSSYMDWPPFICKPLRVVGSASNPSIERVNDIDLAYEPMQLNATIDDIQSKYPKSCTKLWKGLNILSICFPIYGKKHIVTDSYCQIDLMQVSNLGWASWYYQCGDGLNNKYRVLLLAEIFRVVAPEYYIVPSKGVFQRKWKVYHTSDPNFIMKTCFACNDTTRILTPSDALTPEMCFDIILRPDWKHAKYLNEILDKYFCALEINHLPIPKELMIST